MSKLEHRQKIKDGTAQRGIMRLFLIESGFMNIFYTSVVLFYMSKNLGENQGSVRLQHQIRQWLVTWPGPLSLSPSLLLSCTYFSKIFEQDLNRRLCVLLSDE